MSNKQNDTVALHTVPDQTSLDEGSFLKEDSEGWPTIKKQTNKQTNRHYKPKFGSKV